MQKDFVEGLCEDLENSHRFPFFDKRPSSLPKGERFPGLILEAAKQCEIAVVVVSEEYFTSKWPMFELNTFVQAALGSNAQLKIFPLFFGLSISEFGNLSRQVLWFHEWDKWAKDDARIKPLEYRNALKVLRSFNGIEFDGNLRDVRTFRKDAVSAICNIIAPDVKWDDSHVQGRSSICEATREKIKRIEPFGKYGVRIFGFYGMGGIGKTTMCKTLCNELSEFSGKVCHVELGADKSLEALLKDVLRNLTDKNEELLHRLNEGQCQNILSKNDSWKQKTFLALDNVWDDSKSIEQAKMFLEPAFHQGSVVMVTARYVKTLTYLGIRESQCFEVPELGEADARNLFLYHAAKGDQFVMDEDNHAIEQCIARCYFGKGEGRGYHYLPLALKASGMQLGCLGNKPSDWVTSLPKVRDFNHFQEKINPVFDIIRVNFDRLPSQGRALFMDVALYKPENLRVDEDLGLVEWLSLVHRQKLEDTGRQLQRLKEKGLLENVDLKSQIASIHDLYREFCVLESQGKLDSVGLDSRRWVFEYSYPTNLESSPSGRCWEKLIRVGIEQKCRAGDGISSLQGIQWRYCSNIVVLKLVGLREVKGVLNLRGLSCLRSLELVDLLELDILEGLEDLNNLTCFQWFIRLGHVRYNRSEHQRFTTFLGQLPASLRDLQVDGGIDDYGVCLRNDVFARCTNLWKLELRWIRAPDGLDFSNCTSLDRVVLEEIQGLPKFSGLAVELASCLKSLCISECDDLGDVSGLEHLAGLQRLELGTPTLKKLPDLEPMMSLLVLKSDKCGNFSNVLGSGHLVCRQCLVLRHTPKLEKLPDLQRLTRLEVLKIFNCEDLSDASGLEHLVGLQRLELGGTPKLEKLPDLQRLARLEVLKLFNCEDLRDVSGLDHLVDLQRLVLGCTPKLEKLSDLRRLIRLEVLIIFNCEALCDASGVEHLVGLQRLELFGTPKLEKLPDLEQLTSLQNLEIWLCNGLRDVSGLEHLVGLQRLELTGTPKLEKLPDLSRLTSLQVLKISDCEALIGVSGLEHLVGLRWLELILTPKLEKLPGLQSLTSLVVLTIRGCEALSDVSGLEHLVGLHSLELRGTPKLEKLPHIREMLVRMGCY